MARKPRPAPAVAGRREVTTDRQVVTPDEFEAEIRELDGNSHSHNILIYGDNGTGKTASFVGACPNSLIIACEPGYISAKRIDLGLETGKRKLREVHNASSALGAIDYLENGAWKNYEWVVVDGSSTLESRIRVGYAAEAYDLNPEKRSHRNLPAETDYYNTQNFMRGWVSRLVDLPCNVLITAYPMNEEDQNGNSRIMPAFQKRGGELSLYIMGLMNFVGYLQHKKVNKQTIRRLYCQRRVDQNGNTIFAHDKYNALPRFIDNTNTQELMNYITPKEEKHGRRRKASRH